MNENTTTAHGAPGGTAAGPRRLVRTPDKKVAGVAAGIGHYLGVDPTIVRIAFLVLAFAGGIGILLYLACWLVMPAGEAADPVETSPVDPWTAVGIVGLVLGVGLLVGWHGIGDFGLAVVAIALVVGGVLLMGRRPSGPEAGGAPARPAPPTPPGPPGADAGPGAGPDARPADAGEAPVERTSTPEAAAAASGRGRLPVTALALGVLGVGLAVVLALALDDRVDLATSTVLAAALVFVGAAIAVGSLTGGSPWLVPVAALLTASLLVAAAVEPLADRGVGDRAYAPASLADLESEYRLGIGDLTVDLSGLVLAGETRTVEVTLGIGSAEVVVPPDVAVTVDGEVGAGTIETPAPGGVDGVSGLDRDLRVTLPGDPDAGRLVLELDVGIGEGVVSRG